MNATAPALAAVPNEHRFLFDLQGFVLLRGALSSADVTELLAAARALEAAPLDDAWRARLPAAQRAAAMPTREERPGYTRLNGLLRLAPAFDRLIDHPAILPYLRLAMRSPQLVNTWSISKRAGTDVVGWHRGISPAQYSCRDGMIRSAMINVVWFLTDNGPGDGCMCAVPASHKSALHAPGGYDGPEPLPGAGDFEVGQYRGLDAPGAIAITGRAGDVLVFSEALLHGGLPKTTDGVRTNLYFNHLEAHWGVGGVDPVNLRHYHLPERLRARLTPQRRALTTWMETVRHPAED